MTQVDFSNKIDAMSSTFNCTAKRIDVKVKKAAEDLNWRVLEAGSGANGVTAVPAQAASGPGPSYPSSSKVKRDWTALDKEIDSELAKDKPEGD